MEKRSLLLSALAFSFLTLIGCADAAQMAEEHEVAIVSKKAKLLTEFIGGRAYNKVWIGDIYNVRMTTKVDGSMKFDFSNVIGGLAADDLANTHMEVYYYSHNLPRSVTEDKEGNVPSRTYLNAITIDKEALINFYGEGDFYPITKSTSIPLDDKLNATSKNPYVFELTTSEASNIFPETDKYQAMTIVVDVGEYIYYLKSEANGDGRVEVVGVYKTRSRLYAGDIITSDNYEPSGRISYGR